MRVKPGLILPAQIDEQVSPFLRFYLEAGRLKELYRQGWLKRGVPEAVCETVAEHSCGTALLAMVLGPAFLPELDQGRVLQMALIHDLGEVYAGDLTPADGVTQDEKSDLESKAVDQICAGLPGGDEIRRLWQEYDAGETPEARFVRQIDKLEMGLQAGVYALKGMQGMDEFFESARSALQDENLGELLSEMEKLACEKPGLVQFPGPESDPSLRCAGFAADR